MTKRHTHHPNATGSFRVRPALAPSDFFVRIQDVIKTVGLGRSAVYKRIAEGTFPPPIALDGRAVGWLDSEIRAWMNEQIQAANASASTTRRSSGGLQ